MSKFEPPLIANSFLEPHPRPHATVRNLSDPYVESALHDFVQKSNRVKALNNPVIIILKL